MVLGEGENLSIEGEILTFPSSSSSHDHVVSMLELEDSETTTTAEGENITIPVELVGCRDRLVGMGCSPRYGDEALVKAWGRGCEVEEIECRLEGWRVYCESAKGESIRAPGFLAAKRIGEGVDAPVLPAETRDEKAARFVEEAYERIVRH